MNYNHLRHKSTSHLKCSQMNQSHHFSVAHQSPLTDSYLFYLVAFGKTTQPTNLNVVLTYFAKTTSASHPSQFKQTSNQCWSVNSVQCFSKRKILSKDYSNNLIIWYLPLQLPTVYWSIRLIHSNLYMGWAIFILLLWLILLGKTIEYLRLVVPMVICPF